MSKTFKDRDKRDPRNRPILKVKKNSKPDKRNPFDGLTDEEINLSLKVLDHFKTQ